MPTAGTSFIGLPVLVLMSTKTKRSGPTTSSELARSGRARSGPEFAWLGGGVGGSRPVGADCGVNWIMGGVAGDPAASEHPAASKTRKMSATHDLFTIMTL